MSRYVSLRDLLPESAFESDGEDESVDGEAGSKKDDEKVIKILQISVQEASPEKPSTESKVPEFIIPIGKSIKLFFNPPVVELKWGGGGVQKTLLRVDMAFLVGIFGRVKKMMKSLLKSPMKSGRFMFF